MFIYGGEYLSLSLGGKNNLKILLLFVYLYTHTYHNFLFSFALKPAMIHTYINVLSPSCFIIFLSLFLFLIFCTCLIRKVDLVKKKWRGKKKGILHWMDFLPWLSSEIGLLANNSFYTFRRCMKLAKWVWRGGGCRVADCPYPLIPPPSSLLVYSHSFLFSPVHRAFPRRKGSYIPIILNSKSVFAWRPLSIEEEKSSLGIYIWSGAEPPRIPPGKKKKKTTN